MSGETVLRERGKLLEELRQIVQSMKNLAFAELQRVSRMRQAHALAHEALSDALGVIAEGESQAGEPAGGRQTWLVLGAERGFCGAFNAQLAASASALRADDPQASLLIASRRLLMQLEGQCDELQALPGCATSQEADMVLDAWLDQVNLALQAGDRIGLLYAGDDGLVRQQLWPPASPLARTARHAPQTYLPVSTLREALNRQALRLAIQGALYASLEQENHWRLAQMQRAQDHLDELGRALRQRHAALRQANITNELETLASSAMVSGGP